MCGFPGTLNGGFRITAAGANSRFAAYLIRRSVCICGKGVSMVKDFEDILRVRKAVQSVVSYLLVVAGLVCIMLIIALW